MKDAPTYHDGVCPVCKTFGREVIDCYFHLATATVLETRVYSRSDRVKSITLTLVNPSSVNGRRPYYSGRSANKRTAAFRGLVSGLLSQNPGITLTHVTQVLGGSHDGEDTTRTITTYEEM